MIFKALALFRFFTSLKTELKVVLITLAVIVSLPVLSVAAIAAAGLTVISDAFAAVNPVTHLVEVKDADGKLVTTLNATTTWPVGGGVSEEFGVPHMPWQKYHTGIDIADPERKIGDPVSSFMEGTVIATIGSKTGYGKHVIVSHGSGITSLYGHLSEIKATVGQLVKPGDIIGLEGSTGASTGPHVHFEVRVSGIPVNPRIFMVGNPQGG